MINETPRVGGHLFVIDSFSPFHAVPLPKYAGVITKISPAQVYYKAEDAKKETFTRKALFVVDTDKEVRLVEAVRANILAEYERGKVSSTEMLRQVLDAKPARVRRTRLAETTPTKRVRRLR